MFRVGDLVRVVGDTAHTGDRQLLGREVHITRIEGINYYIDQGMDADDTEHYYLYEADMVWLHSALTRSDMTIRAGDRVRRVRGGEHNGMREGDEGTVTRVWSSIRGTLLLSVSDHGAVGFDGANYAKVDMLLSAHSSPREFKVGDKVQIIGLTSGLSGILVGQKATITRPSAGSSRKYGFLRIEHASEEICLYFADIKHVAPVVALNFKEYIKAKMGANVASV